MHIYIYPGYLLISSTGGDVWTVFDEESDVDTKIKLFGRSAAKNQNVKRSDVQCLVFFPSVSYSFRVPELGIVIFLCNPPSLAFRQFIIVIIMIISIKTIIIII